MDYIYEIPNHIDDIVCDDIIEKFEADQTKGAGLIGNGSADETIKKSIDLRISTKEEWSDVDNYLYKKLGEGFQTYVKYLEEMLGDAWSWIWAKSHFEHVVDTGYQIQRVDKGGFYVWHNDHNPSEKREIACIVYLNTLAPDDGGTTDFMIGTKRISIKPEKGKVLFFPAVWPFLHTGTPILSSTKSKYILTTFFKKGDCQS